MEKLNHENLKKHLSREFLFFESITSTFDVPVDMPVDTTLSKKSADIVVAAQQAAGQGRLGRQYFSPQGGIYFCVKTEIRPLLTINAAAGVMRAMQKNGLNPQAKWVNDIMLSGKKVCGILAKSDGKRATIGVGINYCINEFPQDLGARAGSLYKSTDGINRFAALAITEVLAAVTGNNLEFYKSRLWGIGQKITLPSGDGATIVGVADDGSLLYNKDGKIGNLNYGEIML